MPILKTIALSKTYGSLVALKEVSLSIEKQDIYGIIGLSGAGKSTLLRCLAGLISPSNGQVFFQNDEFSQLKKCSIRRLRLRMGMIFQHFNLLHSRTVAGNIAYPLEIAGISSEEREKRIDELLHLVGLTTKKNAYPPSLSGGEKQRVGIARALANKPDILFCDEATSALDPKTTREILDLLKTVNQKLGVTIILITHDMEVIKRICHKVAILEAGSIIEQGSVAEVFSNPQHPTTKHFIQGSSHEIPEEFFQTPSPDRKLLRLRFTGKAAGEPFIAQIVKQYHVDANILLGWIDRLQTTTIGTLIIELTGPAELIAKALTYLSEQSIHYEVLQKNDV
ncbi:MAG: ATP-binding cassette domain-containing protein [Chlamydiales bacterium]|nr:ATP-binding cassette domain-containing protein [Chlamydiales bacterium]